MNNLDKPCDGLLEYLTEDVSDMQRKIFEKHLATCRACKDETILWHEVMNRLVEEVELVDPPADLKEAVLQPLFYEEEAELAKPAANVNKAIYNRFSRRFIGVAVLIVVFLAGWMVRDVQSISKGDVAADQLPTQIETLFHLSANRESGKFNNSTRAYGVACLVRSEGVEQFVVYIFGSPPTQNGEAYKVWLLNEGQRTSAGTFTVGDSGIGIMTLSLENGILDIDSVGVTLEKGELWTKMFSSEEQTTEGDV